MEQLTLGKALNESLRQAMRDDDRVVLLGEDIGALGGVFRITDGLLDEFGAASSEARSGSPSAAIGRSSRSSSTASSTRHSTRSSRRWRRCTTARTGV